MAEIDVGSTLHTLRRARGLSLGQAAVRAQVGKSSLIAWETGRNRPKGPALDRLLHALEAEPRLRAQLVQAIDPAYARIELAHTPHGAPLGIGAIIRTMRRRRGLSQTDLAGSLGVAQATVARWEGGDAMPDSETIQSLGFTLGASPEETFALASMKDATSVALPSDPADFHRLLCKIDSSEELKEICLLGVENELWRRAQTHSRWDPLLCDTIGLRANHLFRLGRLDEILPTSERAMRIASDSESRLAAAPAVGARASLARYRKEDPRRMFRTAGDWLQGLGPSPNTAWMMWICALRRAAMDDVEAAVELTERAVEMYGRHRTNAVRTEWLAEVFLEGRQPERAVTLFPSVSLEKGELQAFVRVEHACGRSVEPQILDRIGAPRNWNEARLAERSKRLQARLVIAGR